MTIRRDADLVELPVGLELERADAEWNEEDHPRDPNGEFGSGGGGHGLASKASKEAKRTPVVPAQTGSQHEHANTKGAATYQGSKDMPKGVTSSNENALFHVMNGKQVAEGRVSASDANHVRRAIKGGYGSIQKGEKGAEIHLTELGKDRQVAHEQKSKEAAHEKLAAMHRSPDRFHGSKTSEKLRNEAKMSSGHNSRLAHHLEGLAREHESRGDNADIVRAVARFDGGTSGLMRFDIGELKSPKRLRNGWLKADAYLTRSGVFNYRLPDGKIQREYRPPSEVFNADSLDTLQLAPVTDEHPPVMLNAVNTVDYSRGAVGERVRKDGSKVAAPIMVQEANLIAKMDAGASQVSCGYTCDLDFTAGVTPEGEKYDAIQRNIRYNHAAILERGRAGPDIRVRMDGAGEAVLLDRGGASTQTERRMHALKIAGITFDVDDSKLAEAITNELARRDGEHAELVKKFDALDVEVKKGRTELQAKLDAALEEIKRKDSEISTLPAKIEKESKARAALVSKVRAVVGSKKKLDGLKDKELRLLALERLVPSKKFDEAEEAYITARFDAEIERFDEEDTHREDGGYAAASKEEEEEDVDEKKKVKKDRYDERDERGGRRYDGNFDPREDEELGRETVDADEIREKTMRFQAKRHLQPIPGARTRKDAYSQH